MDISTAHDMIEDLQIEREQLLTRIRQLEAERDKMRTVLSNLANRFSAQEAKHYRIIRSLESERDQWQRQAIANGH